MAVSVMHGCVKKKKIINFTNVGWSKSKFIESTRTWEAMISYAGVERKVALETIERCCTTKENGNVPPIRPNAGSNPCCYQCYKMN
ncbi:uncharacterized protein LOC120346927 [Styela clava]